MKQKLLASAVVVLALGVGAMIAQGPPAGGKGAPKGPGLTLTSPDITDGAVIDDKYTQKGGQKGPSPKLEWTNVPNGVVTFALLFHDPDAAPGKKVEDVTHWMIFNIPGTARELAGGMGDQATLPDGAVQIKNTRGNVGYMGPGAPAPGPYHHYTFELYALDTKLDLGPDAIRADVMKAMDGHVIAKGVLEGRFHQ